MYSSNNIIFLKIIIKLYYKMQSSRIDFKKLTKDMILNKAKSHMKEFYSEVKEDSQSQKQAEPVQEKQEVQPQEDVQSESEQSELSVIQDNSEKVIDIPLITKQTDINYFYLNSVGILIGIGIILLFFIIRMFCCCSKN